MTFSPVAWRKTYPILFSVLTIQASSAQAGLGHAFGSVEADRVNLHAAMSSRTNAAFAVHTLNLPNQVIVKEFTRPDGLVFAVTWRGAGRPDLRQLLGDSFDRVQADSAVRLQRHIRMPLSASHPDLVVQSGGHSGAFWGAAINPQLQPAGFSASDLN